MHQTGLEGYCINEHSCSLHCTLNGWFCLADTDKQSEQVWNAKYDRHTHVYAFLPALPCKPKQPIMTDVARWSAPAAPTFWAFRYPSGEEQPRWVWMEGWKTNVKKVTENRKKREVWGVFVVWRSWKVHVCKQLLTGAGCGNRNTPSCLNSCLIR